MWRQWKEDSQEEILKQSNQDLATDSFEINKFIKDPDDANSCLEFLKN